MKSKGRLLGIDLFRGIAMYAVVILHSDQGIDVSSAVWNKIIDFCGLAVPFFLAASFYFSVMKIQISPDKFSLRKRIMRLLPPYLIWSAIYIVYKCVKYVVDSDLEQLKNVFKDPISLIFFGSSSIQMYFLPLLMTGTFTLLLANYLIKTNVKLKVLIGLQVLSFIIYEVILQSGNSVQNYFAFQPLLNSILPSLAQSPIVRIFSVFLAWIFLCLPYLFTAMIINHLFVNNKLLSEKISSRSVTIFLTILFIAINLWSVNNEWGTASLGSIYEVSRGFVSLVVAISLSVHLNSSRLLESVSFCSFGIYLSHMIFVEFFMIIENRLLSEVSLRGTTMGLLGFATVSFLLSWTVTSLLARNKQLARLLFG
ncbi:MAG: acyltransferase [Cyanobacteria bacterium J06592_8]